MGLPVEFKNFSSIVGQSKARQMLIRSAGQGKTSHAFLFRGPRGTGKKTLAQAFAAYLNCLSTVSSEDSCGQCPSCRKFLSGNHPDFIAITPEGATIKIRQIRELKKLLSFPPYESNNRVILIADAHRMGTEAANSLLKTLEEPPERNILILTGEEAAGILPTIVSRCHIIPFYPLDEMEIAKMLNTMAGLEPQKAETIAALAEGSIGRARALMESEVLDLRKTVIESLTTLNPQTAKTVPAVFQLAEAAAVLKDDLGEFLELLRSWLQDILLLINGENSRLANHDLLEATRKAAARWNSQQISVKIEKISEAEKQLARHCNRTLICEVLFFALL